VLQSNARLKNTKAKKETKSFSRISELARNWGSPLNLGSLRGESVRTMALDQCEQTVSETPISKIAMAKWTGAVAQVVECLLCKHKALSSNPNPTKNK
jgi:hypothetical protein